MSKSQAYKKTYQKLYDELGYITRHSKNMIVQYQYSETLKRLSDRINYLTDQIEPQAELQQRNKAIDKSTEPFVTDLNLSIIMSLNHTHI